MAQTEIAAALSRAWGLHLKKQHSESVQAFTDILKRNSDQLDALYGLGLAQRKAGQLAEALATFQKLQQHIAAELTANPGNDRFEMLTRIVQQRLAEMKR